MTNETQSHSSSSAGFDPETFMATTVEGQMETNYTPVPKDDYTAFVDDVTKPRKAGDSWVCDVIWNIVNKDDLKDKLGREKLTVKQSLFLDVTDDGRLLMGPNRNIQLGRLRDALKQNKAGAPWNFNMLKGAGPAKISVDIQPDKNDPTLQYNRVTRVVAG